jgi:predicted nucleic acid-binding protein
MIYADTSCLLKVLRPEPWSEAVWSAISEEAAVIVSVLVELETLVQLKAEWTGGMLSRNQWRQAEARFGILRNQPPFEFRALPAAVFQTALRQHRNSVHKHCRSLDRLHLAAMEEL